MDLLARTASYTSTERPGRETKAVERLEQALAIYENFMMRAKAADVHVQLQLSFSGNAVVVDLDRAETHFRKAESLLVELPVSESLASLYRHWVWLCIWKVQI